MAYSPSPREIQDAKIKRLQKQLHSMDEKLVDEAIIRRQLENLSQIEASRKQKAIDKANLSYLNLRKGIERRDRREEMDALQAENNKLLQEVMTKRKKEFEKSQARKETNIRNLAAERQKILEARSRLKEKNSVFRSLPSPVDRGDMGMKPIQVDQRPSPAHTPAYRSVESPHSVIQRAAQDIPDAVERIWKLREKIHKDYDRNKKPYRGELGIDTYQSWQLPDYFMVRGLLQELFDEFIVRNIPADDQVFETEMKSKLYKKKQRKIDQSSDSVAEKNALTLVSEELVLEVTGGMIREMAVEEVHQHSMFRVMSSNIFLKEIEVQGTENENGRDPNDPAYDLVTQAFSFMQKTRDRLKSNVWAHSQYMSNPGVEPPLPITREKLAPRKRERDIALSPVIEKEEPMETDAILISHDHLIPEELKLFRRENLDERRETDRKFWNVVYRKQESNYWRGLRPFVFSVSIPKRFVGCTIAKPSPDQLLLAIGGVNGDVAVYNTQVEPWSLVRAAMAKSNEGPVRVLSWSLDSSRLMAVKAKGHVSVWEVRGEPADRTVLNALEMASNSPSTSLPFALKALHEFSSRVGDFSISSTSLPQSDKKDEFEVPTISSFFPAFSLTAIQDHICTGFSSGSILKLDLSSLATGQPETAMYKPKLQTDKSDKCVTRQGIGAEVMRQHRYPVLHMCYIHNTGRLVTVDTKGYINLWRYDKDFVNGFQSFASERKYKLDTHKVMYLPTEQDKPRIIFTDRNRGSEATRKQIANERRQAQQTLDSLQLGEPWHRTIDNSLRLERCVYAPRSEMLDSETVFNVVERHIDTQQVSTYSTQIYRTTKFKCEKIVLVESNFSGSEIIFGLLFGDYPPHAAHVMILVLQLPDMTLKNFRTDIPLTPNEFGNLQTLGQFPAHISKSFGPTGSEYLYFCLSGRVNCVSLNTGSLVMCTDSATHPKVPNFTGLKLDERNLSINKNHKVVSVNNLGSMYSAFYEESSPIVKILRLEDNNYHESSRDVWKAYQKWEKFQALPSELRLNPRETIMADMKHKEAEMRSLIMSLPFSQEEITPVQLRAEKIENYLPLLNRARNPIYELDK